MTVGRAPGVRSRARRRVGAALFAAVAIAASGDAAIASGPTEVALAELLFREARALVNSGRVAQACAKFAESYRLDAATGTLLNLAICHERQGKYATAWFELTQARDAALREGDGDRARVASNHLASVELSLPKLTIIVPAAADLPGLEVTYDGASLPAAGRGVAIPMDPGVHKVVATAPGFSRWETSVVLAERGRVDITVPRLDALSNTRRDVALVTGATGLATLSAASIAGAFAIANSTESRSGCSDNACNEAGKSLRDDARTLGNVSTGLFIAAGTQLAASAILLIASSGTTQPIARANAAQTCRRSALCVHIW